MKITGLFISILFGAIASLLPVSAAIAETGPDIIVVRSLHVPSQTFTERGYFAEHHSYVETFQSYNENPHHWASPLTVSFCYTNPGTITTTGGGGFTQATINTSYPGTDWYDDSGNGQTYGVTSGSFPASGAPNGAVWQSDGSGGFIGYPIMFDNSPCLF